MATKPKTDIRDYGEEASLSSSSKKVVGHLDIDNARTVTITCKATTNASATSGIKINVYYSPTGERADWDTVPYATFDLNLTAGSNTQETKIFDMPELGELKIEIENLDSTYAATLIHVWSSLKRWA